MVVLDVTMMKTILGKSAEKACERRVKTWLVGSKSRYIRAPAVCTFGYSKLANDHFKHTQG